MAEAEDPILELLEWIGAQPRSHSDASFDRQIRKLNQLPT